MASALINAVHGEDNWNGVRGLVKEDKRCPYDELKFFADMALFSEPIPMKLAMTVRGNIVAHSEIRDLGTARYGIRIAGLSGTVVTPGYRHHGIYTQLILLKNIIVDRSGFFFVTARIKRGYEEWYMVQYPGFVKVKEQDPQNQAWVIRPVRMRSYTGDMLQAAIEHLEIVKKW